MWMSTSLLLLVPWALAGSYQGSLSHKQKVVALLQSLETGDPAPMAYINPKKYIQHNLGVGDGIAGFQAFLARLNGTGTVNKVRVFQVKNVNLTFRSFSFRSLTDLSTEHY